MNQTNSIQFLIDKFIASKQRNEWLYNEYMKVYVRKSLRFIDRERVEAFDVANVVVKPEYQGLGYFKEMIIHAEGLGLVVYVESINNPNLKAMLIKNGYTMDSSGYNAYKKPIYYLKSS